MSSRETKHPRKVAESPRKTAEPAGERERIRDIIIIMVAYPITPTRGAEQLGRRKPWLETLAMLLKVLLAGIAVVKALGSGAG